MPKGSLIAVGLGIRADDQITPEARAAILDADVVLYAIGDRFSAASLLRLRPDAEDLATLYGHGRPRSDTYSLMTQAMVDPVLDGRMVCYAAYGHPGVFAGSAGAAIDRLREAGYDAKMLPGISADACLLADLQVNLFNGLQSYEATEFLRVVPAIESRASLLIWGIGVAGNPGWPFQPDLKSIELLETFLTDIYGPDHEAVIYQAATYSLLEPTIHRTTVGAIGQCEHPVLSTLYVPSSTD